MTLTRQIADEVLKALAVLALVFLSFAHQPTAANAGDLLLASQAGQGLSFCGDAPDDEAGHAPCHACRSDLGTLPQPPCVATSAYASSVVQAIVREDATFVLARTHRPDFPRAPPAAV